MDFEYVSTTVRGAGISDDDWNDELGGCNCEQGCSVEAGCSCLLSQMANYTPEGRLISADGPPILECHENCSCFFEKCTNGVVQNGVQKKLKVFFINDVKGYGVRTEQDLCTGDFVCEYAGECIGPEEVERRQKQFASQNNNFTLTLKENFKGELRKTFVDPRLKGNIGRFINHSCEPNLQVVIIRVGRMIPVAGLFATRDIPSGEELSYDYGKSAITPDHSQKRCECGAISCRGFLPRSLYASD